MSEIDNNNIIPYKEKKIENKKEKENEQNVNNEDNKKDDNKEFDETTPLMRNEKLIKILNDMNQKLNNEKNLDKKLEEIYKEYEKNKNKNMVIYIENSTCFNYFMYYFIAALFVTINLIGSFTLKEILNSLYEIFKNSIKYFLWEESELEKDRLIDFESYYNSSYNFYEQYYKDLSENEVDFDLMMFWDFLGSFLYDSFNFGCASIFFFIVNLIVLAFIGGFNFLDIDEKTHKYSFFQIAYITLVYLILWIAVGSSVLLSQ